MASQARQTVFVELPVHLRILRQPTRQGRDGVVATLAMPGKLDTLLAPQYVDACPVKRCSKRIRVQRLPPVVISLRVARFAIRRLRKRSRLNEVIPLDRRVPRRGYVAWSEAEVVTLAYLIGVLLSFSFLFRWSFVLRLRILVLPL